MTELKQVDVETLVCRQIQNGILNQPTLGE